MKKTNLLPLKGHNIFSVLFAKSKKISNDSVLIAYTDEVIDIIERKKNDSNDILYGVTISKRLAKKAVSRNRVKRLLRESLRIILKDEEVSFKYIIISWRKKVNNPKEINLGIVKPKVEDLLNKILKSNDREQN